MSDEPVAPEPVVGRRPLPRPGAPRPVLPQAPPSKLKEHLVQLICFSTVVLLVILGFKIFKIIQARGMKEGANINVAEEWKEAFDKGKRAGDEIQKIQRKVWSDGVPLVDDDRQKIQEQLDILEDCDAKFLDLMNLLRSRNMNETQEGEDIVKHWPPMKLWVLDGGDLLDGPSSPTEYGGFYIPLHRLISRSSKIQKELAELEKGKDALLQRNDGGEKERTRQQIKKLEEDLGEIQEKFAALYDYVKDGLADPNVGVREIPDLEMLTEEQAKAGMVGKQARELRSQLRD
jgi:hypothetical protein